MAIIGEVFDDFVKDQIQTRQKVYSARERTPEQLTYLNNKNAFVRLISGVDIEDAQILAKIGIPSSYSGNILATNFVLHAGTSAGTIVSGLRSGVSQTTNTIPNPVNSAYGIGGTEFGLNPMMGITSCEITSKNRGSLREAKIQIKAWNRIQFGIIDALYLRLGFEMFLEWGNVTYLNNGGTLETRNMATLASEFLNPKKKPLNPKNFAEDIISKRKATSGNYDGMLAKVKNFDWSFNADGSYDITISLISLEDVIESIKVNSTFFPLSPKGLSSDLIAKKSQEKAEELREKRLKAIEEGEEAPSEDDESQEEDADYVFTERFSNDLACYLYMVATAKTQSKFQSLQSSALGTAAKTTTDILSDIVTIGTFGLIGDLGSEEFGEVEKGDDFIAGTSDSANNPPIILPNNGDWSAAAKKLGLPFNAGSKDLVYISYEGAPTFNGYFIRLGWLLQYIRDYIILYKTNDSGTPEVPIIDVDYNTNTNVCFTVENQISADPRVCVIGNKRVLVDDTPYTMYEGLEAFYNESPVPHGKIMNIYLSFPFVVKTLADMVSNKEDGVVNLYDYLTELITGVNNAMGGINAFEVVIDPETNTLRIIDNNPIPNYEKLVGEKQPATFNIYGVGPNNTQGSFIKDFSIKSEITNNLATSVSIGAQNGGGAVDGTDGTGIAQTNKGFKNRVSPGTSGSPSSLDKQTKALDTEEKYKAQLSVYNAFVSSQIDTLQPNAGTLIGGIISVFVDDDSEWDPKLFDTTKNILSTFLKHEIQKQAIEEKKATPLGGFIPLNVSLAMEGIGGIKLFQRFNVEQKFLPLNYSDSLDFLIKGVNHKIDASGWTTTIESLSIPKSMLDTKAINGLKILKPQAVQTPTLLPLPPTAEEGGNGSPIVEVAGDGKSSPSGYDTSKLILKTRGGAKIKRVMIHHTAGSDNTLQCINGWVARQDNSLKAGEVNCQYVIGRDLKKNPKGVVEQLYDDAYWGYCNSTSGAGNQEVGIELSAYGFLTKNAKGQWVTWANTILPENETAQPVDANLNPIKWQGYERYHRYTPEQIAGLEKVLIDLCKRNPDINPVFDWNACFGEKINYNQIKAYSGIFCHRKSIGKADAFPQRELVVMLQGLASKIRGDVQTDKEVESRSKVNYYYQQIQDILSLKDTYDGGKPLLKATKGATDDEVDGIKRLNALFGISTSNGIDQGSYGSSSWKNKLPVNNIPDETIKKDFIAAYDKITDQIDRKNNTFIVKGYRGLEFTLKTDY